MSLRRKLLITNAIAFGAATVLASAGWFVLEYREARRALIDDLTSQSAILGSNSTASLAFKDPKAATETLGALKSTENVRAAAIYDDAGKLFATYLRDEHGALFEDGGLAVRQPIFLDGTRVGTIYIRTDLSRLYRSLAIRAVLGLLVSIVALALASLLLSRLQNAITVPVYELLQVMNEVSKRKNYSLRAHTGGDDEFSSLAGAFNEMIEQIQTRDVELEFHQKNLEDLVASRTKDLEHALQAEKRFLASMSHEMRTPLNAIIGFTELLTTTELAAEQRKFVENVSQSSRHLLSLVSDILDVSKIEAGQIELREGIEFNLPRLLTECMTIASSRGKEGLRSIVKLTEPPYRIVGDDTRIKQIFINLLSNAHKFTARGTVTLSLLEVSETAESSVLVKVSVEDTGVGIEPDRLAQLFQPFRQLHGTEFSGTGLGLFISRALARRMGGDITVETRKGEGTKFTATLLLKRGASERRASEVEKAQAEAVAADSRETFSQLHVLLVDDVELNIALAEQIFSSFYGFKPDIARNGLEAIEKVRSISYDLVFMDVQMPKMGGIEATREIRALGIDVPIVAMTANALASDIEAARAAGMDDYVTKPIQQALIRKILTRLFVTEKDLSRSKKRAS